MMFDVEKLEWCGYSMVEKIEDMFIRFDRVLKRDGQTQGRTNTARRHRLRLCIASRGKSSYSRLKFDGESMNPITRDNGLTDLDQTYLAVAMDNLLKQTKFQQL